MIQKTLFTLLLVLLSVVNSHSEEFEGWIEFRQTTGVTTVFSKHYLKGNKLRIDSKIAGQESIVISDFENSKAYVLLPHHKTYSVLDLASPAVREMAKQVIGQSVVEDTGKTDTILDTEVHHWVSLDSKSQTDIWLAKDFGRFKDPTASLVDAPAWKRKLSEEGGYPLKVLVRTRAGKELSHLEATQMERVELGEAVFEVPAGFRKVGS